MAEYTNNYRLIKPAKTDYYNIDDFNKNSDIIESALTGLFQSGVDGKALITQSVNAKGGKVTKAGVYPTFQELSTGILGIPNNYPRDLNKTWEDFASPSLEYLGTYQWSSLYAPMYAIRTPEDFGRAAIMSKTESIKIFVLMNDIDLFKYRTTFPGLSTCLLYTSRCV